jgi:hypothetical protein
MNTQDNVKTQLEAARASLRADLELALLKAELIQIHIKSQLNALDAEPNAPKE